MKRRALTGSEGSACSSGLSTVRSWPLGRWLRARAWALTPLLRVLQTANSGFRGESETRGGTVQLLVDELDDDTAHKLRDGAAQLVTDERLDRLG
jgi:hypothetical protein